MTTKTKQTTKTRQATKPPLLAIFQGKEISGTSTEAVYDQVHDRLRNALMTGYFSPGQRIPIRSIAEAAGTSTMPVRTAISRLVATGALIQLPNRRTSVPLITADEYRELSAAKILIETSVVEMNHPLIKPADVTRLQILHEKMCHTTTLPYSLDNIRIYLQLNKSFHFSIYQLSQSHTLMSIIESLWVRTGPYFNLLHEKSSTWNGNDKHAAILKAVQEGSAQDLKAAFQADLQGANELIAQLLVERHAAQP